jgi:hypothetical protein
METKMLLIQFSHSAVLAVNVLAAEQLVAINRGGCLPILESLEERTIPALERRLVSDTAQATGNF